MSYVNYFQRVNELCWSFFLKMLIIKWQNLSIVLLELGHIINYSFRNQHNSIMRYYVCTECLHDSLLLLGVGWEKKKSGFHGFANVLHHWFGDCRWYAWILFLKLLYACTREGSVSLSVCSMPVTAMFSGEYSWCWQTGNKISCFQ